MAARGATIGSKTAVTETYGRYQLVKKIATGGMAQIYLARQLGLEGFEKLLVVKRILPHLAENEDFITMFLDEARIAARLNHPNIVQIFDLGSIDDTFFIAMEYIHGEDVRRVQKKADAAARPIPVPLICRIIIEACAGLDYAHRKGDGGRPLNIVHRDISPQNILVSFEGGVKVVDFGIAKAADQATVTKSGVLKGKYSYMSPEQAAGKPIDARTDIFALGVVLYELLTGTRLFKRSNDIATLQAVGDCQVTPPSQVNPALPQGLDAIVMRALEREREQRFPDARTMQQALEDWLLANKLPSSAVHLASFMQALYADRLQREADEGREKLIESVHESGIRSAEDERIERATPHSNAGQPKPRTRSMRSSSGQRPPPGEPSEPPVPAGETRAEVLSTRSKPREEPRREEPSKREDVRREESRRSTSRPHPPPDDVTLEPQPAYEPPTGPLPNQDPINQNHQSVQSLRTVREKRPTGLLVWIGAGLAAAVVAALVAYSLLSQDSGRLVLMSEPVGALVVLESGRQCRTPCTLPVEEAGRYEVRLSHPGYQSLTQRVQVPAQGQQTLSVSLVKEPEVKAPAAVVVDAGPPEPKAKVWLSIETQPAGADVFLDEESAGASPARVALEPGEQVTVRIELDGYVAVVERVVMTEEDQTLRYALKRAEAPRPTLRGPQPGPRPGPPTVVVDPARGKGKVRFVVNPWAQVDCPPYKNFGATPFPEVEMSAGEYRCTFSNPDLGKQLTRLVRVEADKLAKVQVNMAADQ